VSWDVAGAITDLGTLGGSYGRADAINDAGLIVGLSGMSNGDHATLWDHGHMIDLNGYLSPELAATGWTLNYATSINSQGEIAGYASNHAAGLNGVFILTPVPVPAAVWLFGSGLAALVGIARRCMSV
jgi:probable HAF family extracellular repeat protein